MPSGTAKPASYYSRKTGRVMHFASKMKCNYALTQEFNDNVADIQEQYPLLDLELVENISHRLGFSKPKDKFSSDTAVLTSDFRLVVKDGSGFKTAIREVKSSKALKKKRTAEKLLIIREYWKAKGVPDWKIVTEKNINPVLAKNSQLLADTPERIRRHLEGYLPGEEFEVLKEQYKTRLLESPDMWLFKFNAKFEKDFGLKESTGYLCFLDLVREKRIPVSLKSNLRATRLISELLNDELLYC